MSETAASPAAQGARRKGVRNRLIVLVATVMGLWLVSLAVAVVGLTSARSQNEELSSAFAMSADASGSYSAWLNVDDQSNMYVALAQLNDPAQKQLMADTWATVEENRATQVDALKPQVRTAFEALASFMYEDKGGDSPFEDDPNVYAYFMTFRLRTSRY